MHTDPVNVPEATPAYEWVLGRPLQKMSPSRSHAILQRAFASLLHDWAAGSGWVGTEWRFIIAPVGEAARTLVPDVAYIAAERLATLDEVDREYPPLAPDIVVEILSPGDRAQDVAEKRRVFMSAGVTMVMIVDPKPRTLEVTTRDGSELSRAPDVVLLAPAPGLRIDLEALFAQLDRP